MMTTTTDDDESQCVLASHLLSLLLSSCRLLLTVHPEKRREREADCVSCNGSRARKEEREREAAGVLLDACA